MRDSPFVFGIKNLRRLWDSFKIEEDMKKIAFQKIPVVIATMEIARVTGKFIFYYMDTLTYSSGLFRKEYKVPDGKIWNILDGFGEYACSSIVGNRLVNVLILHYYEAKSVWFPIIKWEVTLLANQVKDLSLSKQPSANFPLNTDFLDVSGITLPEKSIFRLQSYPPAVNDTLELSILVLEQDYTGER